MILALDTSTERAAIGLESRSGAILSASTETARRHGRDLLPRLADTLSAAGLKARDIEVIAVGVGPGSYTGLRVGLMAAKTLAYATGAGVVGFDSLGAIARNAPAHAERISVVADAQRGQLYVAEFARDASGPLRCVRATQIEPLAVWLARLEPATLVLGPAVDSPRIRASLPATLELSDPALNYPDGHRLIELARELWASGRRDDPWLLEPRYLRQSSAEEKWDSRDPQPPN
jgi:tRNA threonylcarbamoyladenosine biosynthesis protein TsaB